MRKGNTVSSVVLSFGLIAVFAFTALVAATHFNTAQSQEAAVAATRGPYMIAGGDRFSIWRIDQATGRVSYCMRDTQSMDPKFIATRPPFCSAWSQ